MGVELTFFNDPKQLKFELFDYDGNTKDDPIGDCVFNLQSNIYEPSNNGFSGRIKLQNCKSGELEIKVIARKLLPLELERRLTSLQDEVKKNNESINKMDGEIKDWNDKNAALQNEINGLIADNEKLSTSDIPNADKELKERQNEGEKLKEEETAIGKEVEALKVKYDGLVKELEGKTKQFEDIKIAEDKTRTKNEHLRKDIVDLKQQIKDKQERKKQIEQERLERDNREKMEKQRLKEEENKNEDKKEEERVPDVGVEPSSKDSNNDKEPLVQKGGATKP